MLILIILLNFLIAVVSQSYENVMNSAMRFKYQQRCELNREAAIINTGLRRLNSYTALILQADHSDNGGNGEDWAGFVQTLKTFIRAQNSLVINKFNKFAGVIEATKKEILSETEANKKEIEAKIDATNKAIDATN